MNCPYCRKVIADKDATKCPNCKAEISKKTNKTDEGGNANGTGTIYSRN